MMFSAMILTLGASSSDATVARPLFEIVPVPAEYQDARPVPAPPPRGAARQVYPRAPGRNVAPPPAPPMPVMTMPPAVPPPPPKPQPPGSRLLPINPGSWVSNDDYPSLGLRENMQGMVRFTLTVEPTGRVSGCQVDKSSGWPVLDRTTCALMQRRARFAPATDSAGMPIAATYTNRFRWDMAMEATAPVASWARVTRFAVDAKGQVMGCFTQRYGAAPPLETQPCDPREGPDAGTLAVVLGAVAGPMTLQLVETHVVDGAPMPAGFTMPEGMVVAVRAVALTIGEDGFVRGCVRGEAEHPAFLVRYMAICAPDWAYAPAPGSDERHATIRLALVRQ